LSQRKVWLRNRLMTRNEVRPGRRNRQRRHRKE
jgi:hypothetical protein